MTQFEQHAHALADIARPIALKYFRSQRLAVDNKLDGGFDPVTVADREIERAQREYLAKHRPNDAILGEEWGAVTGTSGYTWVLDPIDGTRGFISGTPTWGVLVSLEDDTGPILGLIDQPFTQERFLGCSGSANWSRNQASQNITVSSVKSLTEATLLTTFPEINTVADRLAFERVSKQVQLTRYGMDCYGYALLAAGHVDLVIEAGLNAYDISAPVGLIQNAGGIVTDWEGGPAHAGGRALASATPELHKAALELLAG